MSFPWGLHPSNNSFRTNVLSEQPNKVGSWNKTITKSNNIEKKKVKNK